MENSIHCFIYAALSDRKSEVVRFECKSVETWDSEQSVGNSGGGLSDHIKALETFDPE